MEQLLKDIWAIKVPDGSYNFSLGQKQIGDWFPLLYKESTPSGVTNGAIDLPPGSYEILFTTKDCTEEQASLVVGKGQIYKVWYRNYEHKGFKEVAHFKTALPSLQSLLRSKNLDPAKNYLLIKKL